MGWVWARRAGLRVRSLPGRSGRTRSSRSGGSRSSVASLATSRMEIPPEGGPMARSGLPDCKGGVRSRQGDGAGQGPPDGSGDGVDVVVGRGLDGDALVEPAVVDREDLAGELVLGDRLHPLGGDG